MKSFPHRYPADASADPDGPVTISGKGLPQLASAPPAEFGGPGDQWSPETLFVAAVADCFVLTFRAVARASKLAYTHLDCHAEGTLDRVDRVTQFTEMKIVARLTVPDAADVERAERLLHKTEAACLVSSSLKAETSLQAEVVVG
jgi:organic hydroperoxide reductase OsmC/OhrA